MLALSGAGLLVRFAEVSTGVGGLAVFVQTLGSGVGNMEASMYGFFSRRFRLGLPIIGRSLGLIVLAVSPALAQTNIPVPNHSFESPFTKFAWPDADVWEESGPVSEDPQLPGIMETLDTGVFINSPVDGNGDPSPFFISNGDGNQIGFISANDAVDIAFFQQLGIPFEVGGAYTLQVDVGESIFFPPLTFNPNDPEPPNNPDPALLAIRLYYEDDGMIKQTVAIRLVATDELPGGADTGVLLAAFVASLGTTVVGDARLDRPIGIEIRPIDGLSGVWNVDNVRLVVDCGAGGGSGDTNLDGFLDDVDSARLAPCMNGPQGGSLPDGCPPCAFDRLDGDHDGDLDLLDVANFAIMFDG